jgi:hypothetical protein
MAAKFDALCGAEVSEERRAAIREAIGEMEQIPPRQFLELLTFDS